MSDCMAFPDSVDEFMEQYKMVDTEHIYSNGTEYIPIFRMKQWFEHLSSAEPEQKTGKWKPWKAYYGKDHKSWSDELKCSECGFKWGDEEYKYCPMCGAEMEEPDE